MRPRTIVVVAVLAVAAGAAGLAAQTGTAVTIETRAGDLIAGTLVGATDTEVTIRVVGQPITLPLSEVRYVSLVGRIDRVVVPTGGGAADPLLVDALDALRGLQVQVDVGFDDDDQEEYTRRFADMLQMVRRFVESPGGTWADVRLAMSQAAESYREVLNSSYTWTSRQGSFDTADAYIGYAIRLGADRSEESRTEGPAETRVLALGQPAAGRLGAGDREMAVELDRSSAGAYNDLFQFTVTEPMRAEIVLQCTPCAPHLTVTDEAGAKLEGDAGSQGGRSRIRRDLDAGTYYVWAGTNDPGDVGEYTLEVGPRP